MRYAGIFGRRSAASLESRRDEVSGVGRYDMTPLVVRRGSGERVDMSGVSHGGSDSLETARTSGDASLGLRLRGK